MLDNKKKPEEEPIKPVAPSPQPGTPIRKDPDELPVRPAEPSEKPGTAMPFDEPRENN